MLARRGFNVTIAANRNWSGTIRDASMLPWYTRTSSDRYKISIRTPVRIAAAAWHNLTFALHTLRLVSRRRSWDLIIMTNVNVFHLAGWRVIWFFGGSRRIRRLVLNSVAPVWIYGFDEQNRRIRHRGAARIGQLYSLFRREVEKGRILLTAESDHDAATLRTLSNCPVRTLPTPRPDEVVEAALTERRNRDRGASGPVLAWLGRMNREKGFHLFIAASREFLHRNPDVRCTVLIQWLTDDGAEPVPRAEVDALAATDTRLRLLPPARSSTGADYGRLLGRADCLILPYQQALFLGRNSSAALDAAATDCAIITTEGTWMAEQIGRIVTGFTCADQDSGSLARAMERFVFNHESQLAVARRLGVAAREKYSWQRMADLLLEKTPGQLRS